METVSPPLGFSICIPIHNGRRFLAETLESIRAQTYPHWELIIAEDASPEPARDIIEAFAATVTQRVHYIASPVNQGTARTRDLAMSHAKHPYIASLDADDLWHPDHLETLIETITRTQADFVFSGFDMFFTDLDVPTKTFVPPPDTLDDLRAGYYFNRFWLQPSMVAFARDLLERLGGWAKNFDQKPAWMPYRNRCEDRNFFMRVIQHRPHMAWTGKVTVDYRKHATSMTGYHEHGRIDRAWFYNFYGLMDGINQQQQRKFLALLNRQAGDELKDTDPKHAAEFYYQAWCWWPWRVDRLLRAAFAGVRFILPL